MTDNHFQKRAMALGLHGVLQHWEDWHDAPWLPKLLDAEEAVRSQRSLERRFQAAHIGRYKPMSDFDWSWPQEINRQAVEELFTFRFAEEAANVLLLGPNAVGKTMISKNLAYEAVRRGWSVRFTTASAMLNDLGSQEGARALSQALMRYCRPRILVIDELGYLSYDNRHADLLFEVVSRRYEERSIVLTTNKEFGAWSDVFPNAGCVVTLVDRLVHRSEILAIRADSYRLKDAKERAAAKDRRATPK
ncbi:MAG: IS21-like element helper ATPase IstB [Candidatus Sericytochromatia bacterium]|nr:IS21-like element helper ATPase IstB [Candidatus Tanganyikabacteria bacterium]